ncbi:hypothetical protein M408DRAFT_292553 [Serendipita vermifera MAFF 305830]|uniref:Uncharacterized protein n=1 Tax=Serendipita vermifera MAFF 305830 TaxID=933852 RepID=A0A0C3AQ60_SERVB|nr:hypothetical protein M408DRAFT_292553 [Serendipita vermifera MAFF 305830]
MNDAIPYDPKLLQDGEDAFLKIITRIRSDGFAEDEDWENLLAMFRGNNNMRDRIHQEYEHIVNCFLNSKRINLFFEDERRELKATIAAQAREIQKLGELKKAITSVESSFAERFSKMEIMMETQLSQTENVMTSLINVQAAVEDGVAKQASEFTRQENFRGNWLQQGDVTGSVASNSSSVVSPDASSAASPLSH